MFLLLDEKEKNMVANQLREDQQRNESFIEDILAECHFIMNQKEEDNLSKEIVEQAITNIQKEWDVLQLM